MNTVLTLAVALNVGAWCFMVYTIVACRLPDCITGRYDSMLMDDNY